MGSRLALVSLALLALGAPAQTQPTNSPQAPERPVRDTPAQGAPTRVTATGRITGRVLAADTGRPLPRARVTLGSGSGSGNGSRTALTDDEGLFSFGELPAGRYNLGV